jgi:hypothetical protein
MNPVEVKAESVKPPLLRGCRHQAAYLMLVQIFYSGQETRVSLLFSFHFIGKFNFVAACKRKTKAFHIQALAYPLGNSVFSLLPEQRFDVLHFVS